MNTISFDTTVKGGMPVSVEADIVQDSRDDYPEVSEMRLYWGNTGKEVSPAFYNSVTQNDWDRLEEKALYG